MKAGRLGILQYMIQKKASKRMKELQTGQYQDYLKEHIEKFKKEQDNKPEKQKNILKYSYVPYTGFIFGLMNFCLGIYINYISFLGEHQQLWSRFSKGYLYELGLGTVLILLGWNIMVFLQIEELKIDKKKQYIMIGKKRLFQRPYKQYFRIKDLSYFQIWKQGYISKQNNNMQYKLMFVFGRKKVLAMIRLNSIEIKKIFVEIKTFLDQEYKKEELRMFDENKIVSNGYQRFNDEETSLNIQ